jgi:ATP-dependent RNA helicase DeaD
LDVERISHVVNFDIPYDSEAYIHRIGRTGRAGRKGEAILFVAPRERRMLHVIEKATRQKIEQLVLPTTETVNNKRIADFKQKITDTLASGELAFMQSLIEQYRQEHDVPALDIAAALAKLSIGDTPLLLAPDKERPVRREDRHTGQFAADRPAREKRARREGRQDPGENMQRYRVEVGHRHGVKPGNIVGAIANEAGLDGEHIGRIDIEEDYSLVDLPVGMPKDIFMDLKKARVCGEVLNISLFDAGGSTSRKSFHGKGKRAKGKGAGKKAKAKSR